MTTSPTPPAPTPAPVTAEQVEHWCLILALLIDRPADHRIGTFDCDSLRGARDGLRTMLARLSARDAELAEARRERDQLQQRVDFYQVVMRVGNTPEMQELARDSQMASAANQAIADQYAAQAERDALRLRVEDLEATLRQTNETLLSQVRENDRLRASEQAAREARRWIPCSERLPPTHHDVIVFVHLDDGEPPFTWAGFLVGDQWRKCGSWKGDGEDGDIPGTVSHWMPMPAGPDTPGKADA